MNKDKIMIENGKSFTFTFPGKPITKLRPRFARFRSKVKTYSSQSEEENTVKWQLKARMENREPFKGPIGVTLVFVFKKPKSYPKKDTTIYNDKKPDVDNLIKFICDAGNEILWDDDKQIVSVSAIKIYGDEPRTIITVEGK